MSALDSSTAFPGQSERLVTPALASKSAGLEAVAQQQTQGQQIQVQHTVHDLEPLARYSMRVVAVNSIGKSKPSVALSLRTEEEGELFLSIDTVLGIEFLFELVLRGQV